MTDHIYKCEKLREGNMKEEAKWWGQEGVWPCGVPWCQVSAIKGTKKVLFLCGVVLNSHINILN